MKTKMSFSGEVKEELSKLNNLAKKDLVKAEFMGYLMTSNCSYQNKKVKFATENEYNINRFGKLLNNLNCTNYQIDMSGKNFVIAFEPILTEYINYQKEAIRIEQFAEKRENNLNKTAKNELVQEKSMKNSLMEKKIQEESSQKALIRGCFLGSGSINNPKNTYHLEILFSCEENANKALQILQEYGISFKILTKKKNYSIYTKDGEEISKFLALIGANHSVLKFEEIRVYRDMRNHVNRKVNCETANLNKTIDAAVKQIEAIKILQKENHLKELSAPLQEIAILRMENPDASLTELGQMLRKPIGKSGVNHRLKAIEKLAEEVKLIK